MGDKPLYWCNIMISDEDTISWSSCCYNFDQVVNLQMFFELQRCAQMCRICGAKWPINFRGFLEQLLLSVDALQRYMGSWIIIVDTRSGSLPSYHLIMSNTDRPDKPDCWLCSNPMNPNTACFWKAFKEMPIYAQARRAHEHKHGNGVAMTLSYQVPTAPCCIGQVAQLKFAWLWTSLFLTLLFDRWGTLKDLDLDLGKSKCHGNIQCLDLEEIHLFWFVKIH